jgi:hypothetical protein
MSEGGPLINLGDISKPATVLIEKISDAVGAIFRPYQIRRIAHAEADASKIQALAQIEITELHQRALVRMIQEESKKQENIEAIVARALEDLKPDARPESLDNDWLAHFFDKCKLISNAEMQSLWARLLAGEANHPGTFSRKTVEFVAIMDKADAQTFTNLCRFAWFLGSVLPLIYDTDAEIYTKHGINFNTLNHLDSIGLISFNSITGFVRRRLPRTITIHYYGRPVNIEFLKDQENELEIGRMVLTKIGQELAPICGSTPLEDFHQYVISHWVKQDLVVYSPYPKPGASKT